jgi:hypothetical protein
MTNQGEVYFALRGSEFDPNEVTKILGIQPTSILLKNSFTPVRPRLSSWKVSTGKITGDVIDVYEMSSEIVARIEMAKDDIIRIKKQLDLESVLQVVLWITMDDTKSTPAIGFEKNVIAFLSEVGATIDIDTYRNAP